jgi:hypothetical protein
MRRLGTYATLATLAVAAAIVALAPPVHRDPRFHDYADRRGWLGIANAADVLSNLPFVIAGLAGFLLWRRGRDAPWMAAPSFAGLVAIGLGSGGYHLRPGDASISFDFLPIVLTLSWIAGMVIADRHDRRLGLAVAVAGTLASAASVAVWYYGGGTAGGDLRFYVALQATLVVLVALAALCPAAAAPALDRTWILAGVGGFLLARALSSSDQCLYDAIGVSGHTLKHLALGAASACVVRGTLRSKE